MARSRERGAPRGLALRAVRQSDDALEVQVKVRGELFERHVFRWWRENPTPSRMQMTDMLVTLIGNINRSIAKVQAREESRGPTRE